MDNRIKIYNRIAALLIFIGLPVLFYAFSEIPRRSTLKETISVVTLVSFSLMLGQFYLARSNRKVLKGHQMSRVIKWHKWIGYLFAIILLVHPFLVILPRYFESGVDPADAFNTMLTTFQSKGIVLGIIAWCLMLFIGILSIFRNSLPLKYTAWRAIHGISSILFIVLATWHACNLGRHTNLAMTIFMVSLATGGVLLLLRTYYKDLSK